MKHFYIFIFVILNITNTYSQYHYNNWILGEDWMCGLSFNTKDSSHFKLNKPIPLFEENSSISDSVGNLLFYTNGGKIWSRYGNIMSGGESINENIYNCPVIIVPQPGYNCIYYVFTAPGSKNICFNYSIVDLSKGDGFGAVTRNHTCLMSSESKCLAAVGQSSDVNVWVVTQDVQNHSFVAYTLTKDSLLEGTVISPYPNRYLTSTKDKIKFSHDGKRMAMINYLDSKLLLYNFDDNSGIITNEIVIPLDDRNPTYLEFSPNNNILYLISEKKIGLTENKIRFLHQYNISTNNPLNIKNSEYTVFQTSTFAEGLNCLQNSINGKIYSTHTFNTAYGYDTTNIYIIDSCDFLGSTCKLIKEVGQTFRKSILDFPAQVQNYTPHKKQCIYHNITLCEGETLYLLSPFHAEKFEVKYDWRGPTQIKIPDEQNPILTSIRVENSGKYFYTISRHNKIIHYDSITVKVNPKEKFLFEDMSRISVCNDTPIELNAVANPEGCTIRWYSSGVTYSRTNKIKITSSGKYIAVVESRFGCIDSATIEVVLKTPVDLKILSSSKTFCTGEEVILSANDVYKEYLWSTGDTSSKITVNKGGIYNLEVTAKNGCKGHATVTITEYEKPEVEFEKFSYSLCKGDSLKLKPKVIKPELEYIWSDGFPGIVRTLKENASLSLIAKSKSGCTDTALVFVGFFDTPKAEIITDRTEACNNETITLKAKDYNPVLNYKWSNGGTKDSINVNKSGVYKLIVAAGKFCSDTTEIEIKFYPDLNLELQKDNNNLCDSDSIRLSSKSQYDEYLWSTGETTESIFIHEPGIYRLSVKNSLGCTDSAKIEVKSGKKPVAEINADKTEVCAGEKIILTAGHFNPELEYIWSNGEKGERITVTESGTYKLIVSNGNSCADSTEVSVKIYNDLGLEISSDNTSLCFSDSATISAKSKYDKYIWSTGETSESITIQEAGIYSLIVSNEIGCRDTAEIEIKKFDSKINFDKAQIKFDEVCSGESQQQNLKFSVETEFPLNINRIYFKNDKFKINNLNPLLREYQNGESSDIKIDFIPSDVAEFYDTLIVETNQPCNFSFSVPVYGSSIEKFRFSLPEIISDVGKRIEIPLQSALICPNSEKLLTDYEIEITMDRLYFLPENVQFGEIIYNETEGENRVLKIRANSEFENLNGEMKIINTIYGQALIGRSDVIPLVIKKVSFPNVRYFPENINGSLKLNGCVNDLGTLIMFKKTEMKISPNPADGDLKVSIATQEEGMFIVRIYDFQGREVAKQEFTKSDRNFEEKNYTFDCGNLGTGVYSIHLTTPWNILREHLVITK